MRAGLRLLVLVGKAPFPALADNFVNTITRIEAFVSRHTRPFVARVYRPDAKDLARNPNAPGRVELWIGS